MWVVEESLIFAGRAVWSWTEQGKIDAFELHGEFLFFLYSQREQGRCGQLHERTLIFQCDSERYQGYFSVWEAESSVQTGWQEITRGGASGSQYCRLVGKYAYLFFFFFGKTPSFLAAKIPHFEFLQIVLAKGSEKGKNWKKWKSKVACCFLLV